ncbi:MFS general substrate transporter [Peniophora sp. CONT]|nr:MFS general substrate transporter [Peniophora sp. CONT]
MSAVYAPETDADKTAAPSLDLEKGGSDVLKTEVDDEKHESHSGHGHPDHDFREEERDDIPAAVDPPHVAVGDYPDGGLKAWLVVLGGACLTFSTFGFVNTWGSFQAYYEDVLLAGTPSSTIAWIGSVQYALVFLPGLVFGRLFDIGYFRIPFLIASAVLVMCTFLVAECTQYWQFMLCQGLAIGLCSGVLFGPSMGIIGHWFKRRRAIALAIVALGSSTGGTVMPIAFGRLVNEVGFKWTMRILGFVLILTLGTANMTLRRRLPPVKAHGGLFNFAQFKNLAFTFYTIAGFVCFLGLYTLLTYVQASAPGQGVDPKLVPYILALGNTGSAVGRLSTGILGDRFGIMNVMLPFTVFAALFTYIWPFIHGTGPIVAITMLYGVSSGAFVALLAGPIMAMGPTEDVGRRTGMYFTVMAIGALAGPPISGAIHDATGSYKPVGIYAGTTVLAGVACLAASRWFVMGGSFRGKV